MSQRQITIISWNVNGIRAAERKGFVSWLQTSGAEIVAVQETKAHPDQLSTALREPPGYQSHWCAAETKGYSGVATFSRCAPLSVKRGLDDTRFDHEGRVLISTFAEFVLFNIYFPNGGRGPQWVAHKLAFYERFVDLVRQAVDAGQHVVVVGDVNTAYAEIDLARPRENRTTSGFLPEERAGMDAFFSAGLIDTFRFLHPTTVMYTWWSPWAGARERNVGWRLDYILVSPQLQDAIVAAEIHTDVPGSDHCPISVTLAL
ncbi:MAG TPA: exodeoxyribonuclease III [Herpetosiphonaceae bacterium]